MGFVRAPHYLLGQSMLLLVVSLVYLADDNFGVEALSKRYHLGRYWHGFLGEPSKIPSLQRERETPDLWFEQPLDHFTESNKVTWKQRYFVNDEHYRNDSTAPVFLMIGGKHTFYHFFNLLKIHCFLVVLGEAEASKKWMHEGAWIHYAEQFGALCFQLEHRFYGKSHPTRLVSHLPCISLYLLL